MVIFFVFPIELFIQLIANKFAADWIRTADIFVGSDRSTDHTTTTIYRDGQFIKW